MRRFLTALLLGLALAALSISCASGSSAGKRDSGPAFLILPPASWPPESPLIFIDAAGKPVQGAVRRNAVRVSAFGLTASLKNPSLEEDGSLAAEGLLLDPLPGFPGQRPSLPSLILRPSLSDPSQASLEFSSPEGWDIVIEGWRLGEAGLECSGSLSSLPGQAEPGRTATSSAVFTRMLLGDKGRMDWAGSEISDIRVALDMGSGQDSLYAPLAKAEGSELILICDLSLTGGSDLGLAEGSGSLVFPSSRILGQGLIEVPEPSEGWARYRLGSGLGLEISGASLVSGGLSCSGRLFLPNAWQPSGPLSLGAGTVLIRGIRALSLEIRADVQPFFWSISGMRLSASSIALKQESKLYLDLSQAELRAIHALGPVPEPSFSLPLGLIGTEDGRLKPGGRGYREAVELPGYGRNLRVDGLSWGPGGFKLSGNLLLSGILSATPWYMPELCFQVDGSLLQGGEGADLNLLGRSYSLRGLRLAPDGSVSLDSLSPKTGRKLGFVLEKACFGPDAVLRPGFSARLLELTAGRDFRAGSIEGSLATGLRLSGAVEIQYACEGNIFSGSLESEDLRISPTGEVGLKSYRWTRKEVPAFLGLHFSHSDFSLKDNRARLLLSGGSFRAGGVWPRGGRVEGLGLDLDSMRYDVSALRFLEPAILERSGSRFELTGFQAVLDDAYLFSGRVSLGALPGAPWDSGDSADIHLMRLDGYGTIRELKLKLDGQIIDAGAWIR